MFQLDIKKVSDNKKKDCEWRIEKKQTIMK